MSFSPALKHRQAKLARHAANAARGKTKAGTAPAMPDVGPAATEYQTLLIQLHEDLRKLSDIQSIENKIAFKALAIERYLDWCEGALEIEEGTAAPQDEIVVTCMIWAIDLRAWPLALGLAAHVTSHNLAMPERYHRNAACMLVSEMGDAAIAEPGSVPHEVLTAARAYLDPAFDMKDSYRARLHRALGESLMLQADNFDPAAESAMAGGKPALIQSALAELLRAVELDSKVGVKKQIEQLEREEKKLAAAAEGT